MEDIEHIKKSVDEIKQQNAQVQATQAQILKQVVELTAKHERQLNGDNGHDGLETRMRLSEEWRRRRDKLHWGIIMSVVGVIGWMIKEAFTRGGN